MNLHNKLVTVVGLSKRTGVEVVKFLAHKGARIIATDTKNREQLSEEIVSLQEQEVTFDLGGHSPELILESDLLVISPGVPINIPLLEQAREKGIPVISEVELAYRFSQAPILAVTGTNGKTTTTTLLGEIFTAIDQEVIVGGNIGRALIQDLPYLNRRGIAVAEISSFQLEGIVNFKPHISLVLNLTSDHLKRHGDFATYKAAKRKLVSNQTASDYAVLNYDDQQVQNFRRATEAQVVYFSQEQELSRGVFVQDEQIVSTLKGTIEPIISLEKLGIKGPHNVENALGAVAVALLMGVGKKLLAAKLEEFTGVEHRIEEIAEVKGIKYINDSKATNPVSAMKALQTFSQPIVLIGGGMDKGSDFYEWAKLIKEKVKALVLLGETTEKIATEVQQLGFDNIYRVGTIEEAVEKSAALATTGDVVLLSPACASWDMFASYKERGRLFSKAVQELRRG